MGKNKNEMKPKSAPKPSFAKDQIGENAGYEQLNQMNSRNKSK